MTNLYQLLNISPDADAATIAQALARAEKIGTLNPDQLAQCRQWLLSPDSRLRYDQQPAATPPVNPYAPPTTELYAQGDSDNGCFRVGKILYVPAGADLPMRCLKCGEAVTHIPRRRKYYWHHPAWYLLLLLRFFPYVIAALIVRKKVELHPALCPEHRRRHHIGLALGGVGIVLPLLMLLGLSSELVSLPTEMFWILIALCFGLIIASARMTAVIRVKKITATEALFVGAGAGFLDTLPKGPP